MGPALYAGFRARLPSAATVLTGAAPLGGVVRLKNSSRTFLGAWTQDVRRFASERVVRNEFVSSALGDESRTFEDLPSMTFTRFVLMPAAIRRPNEWPSISPPARNCAAQYAAATVVSSLMVIRLGSFAPRSAINTTPPPRSAVA